MGIEDTHLAVTQLRIYCGLEEEECVKRCFRIVREVVQNQFLATFHFISNSVKSFLRYYEKI